MIHDPIGLSDHFRIILQKLAIGYGYGTLVMVSMDEFVHAPKWS